MHESVSEYAPPEDVPIEILTNVVEGNGRSIVDRIIYEIKENEIKLVEVVGAPRGGKTTFVNRFAAALPNLTNGQKSAETLFFDDALVDVQSKYDLGPRIDWDSEWTLPFSMHFHNMIERRLEQLPPDRILVVENVGVGVTDRGLTTLKYLAQDPQHSVDTFHIGLVADPRIDKIAMWIRKKIMETNPDGSFHLLDEQLTGFLKANKRLVTGAEGMDLVQAGRLIREKVSRMDFMEISESSADTEKKEAEITAHAQRLIRHGMPKGRERLPVMDEMIHAVHGQTSRMQSGIIGTPIPASIRRSGISRLDLATMETQVAYFKNVKSQLGIKSDRFIIAFNPYIDGVIPYLDLSDLRNAA